MLHGCARNLWQRRRHETKEASSQANFGPTKAEDRFVQEYVERATELRTALHEEHKTVEGCERELVKVRKRNRALEAEVQDLEREVHRLQQQPRHPERIAVATQRGQAFHLPGARSRAAVAVSEFSLHASIASGAEFV